MRELYSTAGAAPWFGVNADDYPGFEWALDGDCLVSYQEGFQSSKEEFGWDLPKLVRLSMDEDFLAVLEDGRVVQICNNEGNFENEEPMGVTTFAALLEKYCTIVEAEVA